MNDLDTEQQRIKQHYSQWNKLFEHRTRLAICALLNRYDKIAFSRFKELLQETDGNLGAQLRKLEDAGLINVDKDFENRRPVSWYSITADGKHALLEHIRGLEAIFGEKT